jgi:histidinol-phosphate aminotransferase
MRLNRRNLLKQLGAGVAATSLLPSTSVASETVRTSSSGPDPSTPARNAAKFEAPIRLDRNENAYGASEKAISAMQQSASLVSRYPGGNILESNVLANNLAAHHSALRADKKNWLRPEQIVLGCGSTEILRMAACAFLGPGKTLIQATPTCDLLLSYAQQNGAKVIETPLRKDYAHDLDAMLRHAQGQDSGLVYICNPNSPTGTLTPRHYLEALLPKFPPGFHLLIDEAYHEYAGGSGAYASMVDRPSENSRVIVSRTFSAAHGLAGARVGYAVTSFETAAAMNKASLPYALNRAGIAAASASLADPEHLQICAKRNFDDRQEFMNQVNARMLRALDSHANFVCLNVMRPAAEIAEHYAKNNFVLAPLIPSLPNYLRISLGTPQEMHEFWRVWDLLGSHPMSM